MIDPDAPLATQVERQAKIIDALLRRTGREHEVGGSAYSLFQSAIALQNEVWAKTRDLEAALDTLDRASDELELARFDSAQSRTALTEALAAMEGGFALFSDGKLRVCNDLFRLLLPDVTPHIAPEMPLELYLERVQRSVWVVDPGAVEAEMRATLFDPDPERGPQASFVLALRDDRWFQVSQQRTSSNNLVVLQTEITEIVRRNRVEKDLLIDKQAHYLQAAFDHMSLGIATFSKDGMLMIRNARFGRLLDLPFALTQKGASFPQVLHAIRRTHRLVESDAERDTDQARQERTDRWPRQLGPEGQLQERLRHRGGRVIDLHVHRLPDQGLLVDVADASLEHRATEVLERRVATRTSELTRANQRLRQQHERQALVEEELRLAKEKAEEAVTTKSRFLAAASHDLLQPVNAAKLLISTLKEQGAGPGAGGFIERLDGSFASIEAILHSLLDISRLDSSGIALHPTDVSLDEVMRAVHGDAVALAEGRGIRLTMRPTGLWVRSDRHYLMRSLQNLVANAIQYTEKGGVLVGCRARGDEVLLQVWDTGCGISTEDQSRIFEEFTRVSQTTAGSNVGLGLSIVERSCRHLGHSIDVDSVPGRGSVFTIRMQRVARSNAVHEADSDVEARGHLTSDLIVMVIENDDAVMFATTSLLEGWGASVLAGASAAEALRQMRDIGMAPDIILADYQLDDGLNGADAIADLRRAAGSDIPAIVITADRSNTIAEQGFREGFSVLAKPVQAARLRALIEWKTRQATDKSIA